MKRIKELEDLLAKKDKEAKDNKAKLDYLKNELGIDDKDLEKALDPKNRNKNKLNLKSITILLV